MADSRTSRRTTWLVALAALIAAVPALPKPKVRLRGQTAHVASGKLQLVELATGRSVEVAPREVGAPPGAALEPLAFSPDCRRLAVRTVSGENRILVLHDGFKAGTWVTEGLVEETRGTERLTWDHRAVAWSPDGKQLAVVSRLGTEAPRVAVWSGGKLHALPPGPPPEPGTRDVVLAWAPDGAALFASPSQGPAPHTLFALPVDGKPARSVWRGAERQPIVALARAPTGASLAVVAGRVLLLSDGQKARVAWESDSALREATWSPDGKRIALADYAGSLTVVGTDGGEPWQVTGHLADRWSTSEAAWLGPDLLAAVVVTRGEGAKLVRADASTRLIVGEAIAEVAASRPVQVPGTARFAFLKVVRRGSWRSASPPAAPSRTRTVGADLVVVEGTGDVEVPVTRGGPIEGVENEGDFAPHLAPLICLR